MDSCLFFSQSCVFCDLTTTGETICDGCLADLPRLTNPCLCCAIELPITSKYQYCRECIQKAPLFYRTYAAFSYQFPINLLIPKIKLEQQRFHLKWLAQALALSLQSHDHFTAPQVLIPVPISKRKRLRKGYNQTDQLAAQLSRILKIEIDHSLLLKNRDTLPQAQLNAAQRKKNLESAFVVNDNQYKHVAIIDDVMTTGSTANEIAKALRASGIQQVDLWILARTPL